MNILLGLSRLLFYCERTNVHGQISPDNQILVGSTSSHFCVIFQSISRLHELIVEPTGKRMGSVLTMKTMW